jgi:parallel beta-helix repeat protein
MGTGFWLTGEIAAMLVLAALVQPAYAITDCASIDAPGAYALENDITDTAALKCINITVSNVSLDGAGFTIDGVGTASGAYGIYVYNGSATLDNVTIGNVTVTDFSEGLFFNSVENGSILNCTLALNVRDGAWLNSSGYNSLSNNTLYNNSIYGIYITGSPNVELRGNTLHYQNGTNDAGIYADRADGIGIHGSLFYDNWLGAYIRNSTSVSISNSPFLRHGKEAMRIINVSGGNITGNYANTTEEQVI